LSTRRGWSLIPMAICSAIARSSTAAALGALMLCSASLAQAAVVTVTTSDNQLQAGVDNQGWWSTFAINNNPVNDKYFTELDDFRSFFSFDLSTTSGTVTSATFEVRRYDQFLPVTLGLFDVSTPAATLITTRQSVLSPIIFADLGTGNSYGTFNVNTGASTDILSFALNATALADINSTVGQGFFSVGARVLSGPAIFSASNQEPGSSDGQFNSVQRLVLNVQTVPEPNSLVLMFLGLIGLGLTQLIAAWIMRRGVFGRARHTVECAGSVREATPKDTNSRQRESGRRLEVLGIFLGIFLGIY